MLRVCVYVIPLKSLQQYIGVGISPNRKEQTSSKIKNKY